MVGWVFQRTCQGGTGNGAGIFHYSYRCDIFPDVEGDPSLEYVALDGQAPKRFMMYGGVSPVYDRISMKWSLHPGYVGRSEGKVVLDLASNTINEAGHSVALDSDRLLDVLGIPDRPANRATLKYLLDTLDDCHKGRVPRPSHLGYHLEQPMPGYMQHVALGYSVDYYLLTWVGIWSLAVIIGALWGWSFERLEESKKHNRVTND